MCPMGPLGPFGPIIPVGPVGPFCPMSPTGPFGPRRPGGPGGPWHFAPFKLQTPEKDKVNNSSRLAVRIGHIQDSCHHRENQAHFINWAEIYGSIHIYFQIVLKVTPKNAHHV